MPYFTAALCGSMSSPRYILRRAHTLPCPSAKDYTRTESSFVRLSFRRRPQGSLTVTLCCIHVVHLNTLS